LRGTEDLGVAIVAGLVLVVIALCSGDVAAAILEVVFS
jgi:hypothetical protein